VIRCLKLLSLALVLCVTASAQSLNGAGASFPNPIYQKWFLDYSASHNGVRINYQSVGSGAGIRQVIAGTVDFGATDGPMNDKQLTQCKQKILHIPTVLGAVVPAYNIPGVSAQLNFTPDVLVGIYIGKITDWSDKKIAAANPNVRLPKMPILVVHRSDGSGTTYIFTDYLSKVSKDWGDKVGTGTSVRWPVGLGGKGNEGVAGTVSQLEGSIGYVELIYAVQNNIPYGAVQNKSGNFVKASMESTTAAAAAAAAKMPADYRVSITNPDGADAYPIASFTWLLIPQQSKDATKGKVLQEFLKWMVTEGQTKTASLHYAPLPPNIVKKLEATIATVR